MNLRNPSTRMSNVLREGYRKELTTSVKWQEKYGVGDGWKNLNQFATPASSPSRSVTSSDHSESPTGTRLPELRPANLSPPAMHHGSNSPSVAGTPLPSPPVSCRNPNRLSSPVRVERRSYQRLRFEDDRKAFYAQYTAKPRYPVDPPIV